MLCVAVFVDAGYLFAQGSTALTGSEKPRAILDFNETAAIAELIAAAKVKCGAAPLLRIYWYDAAPRSRGPSLEHLDLAHTDYVKLRLGFMNSQGEQKGVDSLIVTDLIELARNHAISDALLLSGDEDVRIGVVIAQSLGVRVHLLGIAPCRGSQSLQLMQESDTTTEWDAATVGKFLTLKAGAISAAPPGPPPATGAPLISAEDVDAVAAEVLATIDGHVAASLHDFWKTTSGLPPEIDGKLLVQCRDRIGRDLSADEKRGLRKTFIAQFKAAYPMS